MTLPENIVIFLCLTLIISLLANAAFIGLLVAYTNTERDRLFYERKMMQKGKRE
jgi:hypothetical protein